MDVVDFTRRHILLAPLLFPEGQAVQRNAAGFATKKPGNYPGFFIH
jgi:hypothetical protein